MRSGAAAAKQSVQSRRLKRLEETHEIQTRVTHRRRKLLTRGGVLAGFGMAMGVYPVMGTIAPPMDGINNVAGIVRGEAPSTAHAILGDGPTLTASFLPLPSPDEQARAMAVNDRYVVSQYLPDCDPTVEATGGNGELNVEALCTLWGGIQLRADAAVALAELNHRFNLKFGRDMCIYEGYRSLSKQYETKRRRGFLAATPGTSVHGWGLAFDLCGGDDRGETKQWIEDNGAAWGWVNPHWAKTRKFEPWHFEYKPGTDAMDYYGSNGWEADGGGAVYDDTTPDTAPAPPKPATTTPPPTEPEPDPAPQPTAGTTAP
ncbi:MAG: hypothetical protein CVT64_09490 [Actinobacteria bacterium HGW-Actinobacteria-4]|nr:MAG: hypothetical protein CVT64_09490 [Actinobacteria bacterium HGW-Actinobacteria-4]